MTWAELFARADEYEVDLSTIRERLARRREEHD